MEPWRVWKIEGARECVCAFALPRLQQGGELTRRKFWEGKGRGEEEISSTLRKKGEGKILFCAFADAAERREASLPPNIPTALLSPRPPPCPQGTESSVSGRACSVTENKNLSYFPPSLSFLFFMRRDGVGKKSLAPRFYPPTTKPRLIYCLVLPPCLAPKRPLS